MTALIPRWLISDEQAIYNLKRRAGQHTYSWVPTAREELKWRLRSRRPTGWKFTLKTTGAIFQLSCTTTRQEVVSDVAAPELGLRLAGCSTSPPPPPPPPWEKVPQDTVGWNAGRQRNKQACGRVEASVCEASASSCKV